MPKAGLTMITWCVILFIKIHLLNIRLRNLYCRRLLLSFEMISTRLTNVIEAIAVAGMERAIDNVLLNYNFVFVE